MKIIKILSIVIILIGFVIYTQYPKLNIIAGYAAKNMSSNVFIANRAFDHVHNTDNKVPSIKLAKTEVNNSTKITTSSVFGILSRKAFFREGQGSVVIDDTFDIHQEFLIPKRTKNPSTLPYPYGSAEPIDTVFSNINYTRFETAIDSAFIENNQEFLKNTRAVLVLYRGHLIAEKYGEGFDKDTEFLGWSMAKSLLATVIGVLEHKKGFDIHAPVSNFLPLDDWKKDKRSEITTHHLLKMISGLAWEEDYTKISDVTKMLFLERDMTLSQTKKELEFDPGNHFNYSSGTTNVLSGILRSQFDSHQEYLDFPYVELIDKIGMNSMLFETDMEGNYVGSSYAWATARDWAKLGQLYLNNGNWNGTQIFNEKWAAYTAEPTKASANEYGAQFWTNSDGFLPDAPKDMYYADGYHGQRIFIIPSKDLVIVRTGLTHKNRTGSYDIMNSLIKEIVGSIN
ncbi:serine hydrolase domain-containing protein [Flavicella marina]|uniref:serine hydrolase domain-containing protein n=1 Tax=Flavicella marina TaxID=1475951 RepID=UPI00126584B4|nr:serine hydrolase [Flavicella marina]